MERDNRAGRGISVYHYALFFAFATLLLFIGLAWLVTSEIGAVRADFARSNTEAARIELAGAVDTVVKEVHRVGRELADWEEVAQQFKHPTYYEYWRNHRMRSAGILPDFVQQVEIYDRDGTPLRSDAAPDLPSLITGRTQPYLELTETGPGLVVIEPVPDPTDKTAHLGYISLRADFLPVLFRLNRLRLVDTTTLRLEPGVGSRLMVGDIASAFAFEVHESPETEIIERLMLSAVAELVLIIGVLSLVFYPTLVYLIAKPLRLLAQHIDKLKQSSGGLLLDHFPHSLPVAELEKIRRSLNAYQSQLAEIHESLDEKNRELWKLAYHDPLTGMRNRRALDQYWQSVEAVFGELQSGVCLALYDVSHFKAINDSYGHQIGDEVLKTIASILRSVYRDSEHLYRIGGDELEAILIDCDTAHATKLAQQAVDEVSRYPFVSMGIREPVRISVGLAKLSATDACDLQALHWQADVAMSKAKRPGSGHIAVFSQEMAEGAKGLFSTWVNSALYDAISTGTGLSPHFQPIVDLRTGKAHYYEALCRLESQGELLLPSEVLQVVEARKLELEFDRAVIAAICREVERGLLPAGSGVSINVSGPAIVHPDLFGWLAPLERYLEHYRCVLEVTETALITQIELARANIAKLRSKGFVVALDDFGSGYSSLRYLATMPVDVVKFDTSLVRYLGQRQQRGIVLHLVQMIRDLGHELVAEGIETEETLLLAEAAGFRYGQGYLLGKPEREPSSPAIHLSSGDLLLSG